MKIPVVSTETPILKANRTDSAKNNSIIRGESQQVSTRKREGWVEVKAHEKFFHRHTVDILRIKFSLQHRYRENWPFMDGRQPAGGVPC